MKPQFSSCPSCSSGEISAFPGFERKHLLSCSKCGLVFDQRVPTDAELSEYYRQYSYSTLKLCSAATTASFKRLLEEFEPWRQTGRVLDIGCGQGDFLKNAQEYGWSAMGHEYSQAAVALCQQRGIEIASGPLSKNTFPPESFDVITAFEVIEHINNPNDFFSMVHSLLRPGGLFYCTTPNFDALLRHLEGGDFKMIVYPEHLSFYSGKALKRIAKAHNFKPLRIRTTGIDLARLRQTLKSKRSSNPALPADDLSTRRAQNDAFRSTVEDSVLLQSCKAIVNSMLTLTRTGDTLKGYFLKHQP